MSALTRTSLRFSHVGRRPVIFEPARISLTPIDIPNARSKGFQQTPIVQRIVAKGPLGELSFPIHQGLKWEIKPGQVECEQQLSLEIDKDVYETLSKYDQKFVKSMWGTTASGLNRIVEGVSEGFQVSLKFVGVGYKAAVEEGRGLVLKLGYSHDIVIPLPEGIKATCPTPTRITLFGIDFQKVTQFAAFIRSKRKPEPYNGKGIFVGDETIALKEGKKK